MSSRGSGTRYGPSLQDRFSTVCCDEKYADVHFVVGDDKARIPAHKLVLSVGSEVFHTMFYGEMESSGGSITNEVRIPDVEVHAFLLLLRFLYADDVNLSVESVMTTLYAAKKYNVEGLVRACTNFLSENIKPENAFLLLSQSEFFGEKDLSNKCLAVIDRSTIVSLSVDSFTTITFETLCTVLKRPTFKAPGLQVFRACSKWAEEECKRKELPMTPTNQREVLDEALELIDFDSIPLVEFSQSIAKTGILTDSQLIQLFQRLTIKEKERQIAQNQKLKKEMLEKERLKKKM